MMKSFFKKLAFVMALAMVVSMVTPAGSALAAEAGVALQGTKTIVETYELEKAGATVDFAFEGCTTWKEYKNTDKWGWTSSNEAVATVDKAGVVTAVAAGTATITITVGDDYKESVVVTVKGEEAAAMAVVQLTEKTSKLVFNKKVDFKKEDAKLVRVFETDVEAVEVNWPIDTWKVAKDGMSITFGPFVEYADGDKYIITVGDFTQEFTTVIGEVTHAFTTYATNYVANTAFITPEDADDDIVTNLGVQFMSGTVDLTGIYASKYDISYAFYQDAEYENASLDENDGEITFTDKGDVTVTAVVGYEDEEGEDQLLANVMPVTITPAVVADYEVVKVADWTLVHKDNNDWTTFSWDNKSLYAGDEDYVVVLKLQDNRGNNLVTRDIARAYEVNKLGSKNTVLATANAEFDKLGYAVEFYSTNTDDFLVDTDGSLATYKKTNAVVYVKLFADDENGDKTFLKNIYAFEVKVDKARTLTNLAVDEARKDVVVDALANVDSDKAEEKLTEVGFWVGAFDQAWNLWASNALVANGKAKAAEFEIVATTPAELLDTYNNWMFGLSDVADEGHTSFDERDGAAWLWINARGLYGVTDKTTVKFTIQEKNSKEKITVTLNLRKPDWAGEDETGEASLEGKELVLETSKGYYDVLVEAADIDLGYNKSKDTVTAIEKAAKINLFKLSNDQKVGYFYEDEIADSVDATKKWYENTPALEEGKKYIAVVGPDDKPRTVTWDGKDAYVSLLTMDTDDSLKYDKAGKYTVYVYTVYEIGAKKANYVTRKDTFTVSYGQATVACVDRVAIDTEYNFKTDASKIANIIAESFAWTLDGKAWDIEDDAADIVDLANTTYTIKGDNIIINKVTFKVPYDGGNTLTDGEAYYTKTVEVNKAIALK